MSLQTDMNDMMTKVGEYVRLREMSRLFRLDASGTITITQAMIDRNNGFFLVRMCGAGGGGGGGGVSNTTGTVLNPGTGGGGGEYRPEILVEIRTPGTYSVQVGAGGIGGDGGVSTTSTGGFSGQFGSQGGDTILLIGTRKYDALGGGGGGAGAGNIANFSSYGGVSGGWRRAGSVGGATFGNIQGYGTSGVADVTNVNLCGLSSGAGGWHGRTTTTGQRANAGDNCLASGAFGGAVVGVGSSLEDTGSGGGASWGDGGAGGPRSVSTTPPVTPALLPNTGGGGGGGGMNVRSTATVRTGGRGADGSSGFFELYGRAI